MDRFIGYSVSIDLHAHLWTHFKDLVPSLDAIQKYLRASDGTFLLVLGDDAQ